MSFCVLVSHWAQILFAHWDAGPKEEKQSWKSFPQCYISAAIIKMFQKSWHMFLIYVGISLPQVSDISSLQVYFRPRQLYNTLDICFFLLFSFCVFICLWGFLCLFVERRPESFMWSHLNTMFLENSSHSDICVLCCIRRTNLQNHIIGKP